MSSLRRARGCGVFYLQEEAQGGYFEGLCAFGGTVSAYESLDVAAVAYCEDG
jgi:hypothetical protein